MKIGAIILSRMDSSRLPGKALLKVGGKPILAYALSLCHKIDDFDSITLATSTRTIDDPLLDFAKFHNIKCFRGSLDNVADRFLSAMKSSNLDAAVRVNGDSPLNNKDLVVDGIEIFKRGNIDIVSNVPERTYPYGMSVEVVGRKPMERACSLMNDFQHKEHVTKYFYDNSDKFNISLIRSGTAKFSDVQLAIDTQEDFEKFEWIIENLECDPSETDIATLVRLAKDYHQIIDKKI